MRAKEFITENKLSDVHDALEIVGHSLPYTYKMTQLKNNDFYPIYRFGVAIAAVRGEEGKDNINNVYKPKFKAESAWGENEIVSSFDPDIGRVIDKALGKINKPGKTSMSSPGSQEMKDTNTQSPVTSFKGYSQ